MIHCFLNVFPLLCLVGFIFLSPEPSFLCSVSVRSSVSSSVAPSYLSSFQFHSLGNRHLNESHLFVHVGFTVFSRAPPPQGATYDVTLWNLPACAIFFPTNFFFTLTVLKFPNVSGNVSYFSDSQNFFHTPKQEFCSKCTRFFTSSPWWF